MNTVEWTKRIRSELKCGIINFYALDKAFEITVTRLVGDDRFEHVEYFLFRRLEEEPTKLLNILIANYQAKYPHFFTDK